MSISATWSTCFFNKKKKKKKHLISRNQKRYEGGRAPQKKNTTRSALPLCPPSSNHWGLEFMGKTGFEPVKYKITGPGPAAFDRSATLPWPASRVMATPRNETGSKSFWGQAPAPDEWLAHFLDSNFWLVLQLLHKPIYQSGPYRMKFCRETVGNSNPFFFIAFWVSMVRNSAFNCLATYMFFI